MIIANGKAHGNALTEYDNITFLAKNKQPGAPVAYDEVCMRFSGSANAKRKTKGYEPSYAA